MNKLFWHSLIVAPAVIAASLLTANGAYAQTAQNTETTNNGSVDNTLEQINNYQIQRNSDSLSQVTNVNQLRDVQPTDWAYEALRSLVDRYGCIAGFPNQTYRGSQALSRYEFAAGLNSCLNQIERLIASSESVVREDVETMNRLAQEFEAELATLGGRVDEIESRTATLEDNQFSTTAKLKGEAIFALANVWGGDQAAQPGGTFTPNNAPDLDSEVTFSNRVRLNFDSSFYGEDRLRVRLSSGNVPRFTDVTGTNSTRLGFDFNNGNEVEIEDLHYRFPTGDRVEWYVGTQGLNLNDVLYTSNPLLKSSGTGALSRFNRRDPVVLRSDAEGAGAGLTLDIVEDTFSISGVYLADDGDAFSPDQGQGIFNGSNSIGGQLVWSPNEDLNLAATYVRSYTVGGGDFSGGTSSGVVSNPFGADNTNANRVGLGVDYTFRERFVIAGWGSYADAKSIDRDLSGDVWSWNANFSILDLGKEGAVLAVAGGRLPKFTTSDAGLAEDGDTSHLVELLYKYPINDNILLTPGGYVVFNPNNISDNDTQYVGVIRTTFTF